MPYALSLARSTRLTCLNASFQPPLLLLQTEKRALSARPPAPLQDRNWLRQDRRWPAELVDAMVAFLDIKD